MRLQRKLAVSAALLAATALPGCAAVAIPVLAGGALLGTNIDPGEAPAPGPRAAAVPAPTAASSAPATTVQAPVAQTPSIITPTAVSAPPQPPEAAAMAPATPPPAPAPAASATSLATMQLTGFDPAFAAMASYAVAALGKAEPGKPLLSALLKDPVALDGQRQLCLAGQQAAVVIDLDPAGGLFAAPANPTIKPEHASALASLRDAGITIAWISDNPITQTGAIRTALEQSGMDPRGEDILVLRSDGEDRKQVLRNSLANNACILAIAGDERPDFDERFRYLRNPAAGAGLEVLIGDGWFLTRPIFSATSSNEGTK
jgi:hypothetical protein